MKYVYGYTVTVGNETQDVELIEFGEEELGKYKTFVNSANKTEHNLDINRSKNPHPAIYWCREQPCSSGTIKTKQYRIISAHQKDTFWHAERHLEELMSLCEEYNRRFSRDKPIVHYTIEERESDLPPDME